MTETNILSVLADMLYEDCGLFARVTNGVMPPGNAVSVKFSSGSANSSIIKDAQLNGIRLNFMRITFFVRHSSDKTALQTILAIAHSVRNISYNAPSKGFPPETFLVSADESPVFCEGNSSSSVYSLNTDIYYIDQDGGGVSPEPEPSPEPAPPPVPDVCLPISFNGGSVPNVVSYNAVLKSRGAKILYNADGDMLVDLLPRKFHITVHLEKLCISHLNLIYSLIAGSEFFTVTFVSPSGICERVFFMQEKPAEFNSLYNGELFCKELKLELEER